MRNRFTSQICTTPEQSERLIDLGIKLETADMTYYHGHPSPGPYYGKMWEDCGVSINDLPQDYKETHVPAWSLHRLIQMLPKSVSHNHTEWYKVIYNNSISYDCGDFSYARACSGDLYDDIITVICTLIGAGHFDKTLLNE